MERWIFAGREGRESRWPRARWPSTIRIIIAEDRTGMMEPLCPFRAAPLPRWPPERGGMCVARGRRRVKWFGNAWWTRGVCPRRRRSCLPSVGRGGGVTTRPRMEQVNRKEWNLFLEDAKVGTVSNDCVKLHLSSICRWWKQLVGSVQHSDHRRGITGRI